MTCTKISVQNRSKSFLKSNQHIAKNWISKLSFNENNQIKTSTTKSDYSFVRVPNEPPRTNWSLLMGKTFRDLNFQIRV